MHDTLRSLALPVLVLAACGDEPGPPGPPAEGDSVPPAVVSLSPAPGDTGVSLFARVEVTFSEALNWATLGPASFFVLRQLDRVAGSYEVEGLTAVFRPDAPYDSLTSYAVTLTSAVRDSAGNRLPADTSWSFRTGGLATARLAGAGRACGPQSREPR